MALQPPPLTAELDSWVWKQWFQNLQIQVTSGGSGGAPTNAQYVTLATDATLTAERVLTAGTGISLTDAGAGSTITVAARRNAAIWGQF